MTLRQFLSEINERPTTTDQKQRVIDDDILRQRQSNIVPSREDKQKHRQHPDVSIDNRLSREQTAARLKNVVPNEEMVRKLQSIDPTLQDEITDAQAREIAGVDVPGVDTTEMLPVPVKPNTLPKVINTQLQAAGHTTPQWSMVKHLPGYLAAPIRSIGRSVFKPFTSTPLEEIQVIANLMGQGPNEEKELSAVANYLVKHSRRDRDAELVFHDRIPDYGAEIKVFRDSGITFMLVNDFAGHYIYAWPSDQEYNKVEVKEGKEPQKKPSARQHINQILVTRKSGAHYTEKFDYKRAKEKQKIRKMIKGEE